METGKSNKRMLKIRKLTLHKNLVNRTYYEEPNNYTDSFFRDVYIDAYRMVDNIIMHTFDIAKETRVTSSCDFQLLNNIISFIGERGTGKSSAMLSFSRFLRNFNKHEEHKGLLPRSLGAKSQPKQYISFVTLDVIDPTLMGDDESLLELIVAKMFSKFNDFCKSRKNERVEHGRNSLLDRFEKTYRAIVSVRDPKNTSGINYLSALQNLSLNSNLRNSFDELVKAFLEFVDYDRYGEEQGYVSHDRRFLVITIDDMDMNLQKVFSFSEEIRKYLMVPNVIILMSYKYDQYRAALLNHYLSIDTKIELYSYSRATSATIEYEELIRDQNKIVREYMEKMFPLGQRITLPTLVPEKTGADPFVQLCYEDDDEMKTVSVRQEEYPRSVQQYLYHQIFMKTRLRLAFRNGRHPFDVENLRELHNYIHALESLYPYVDGAPPRLNFENCMKNIDWFVNDLVNRWGTDKLTPQDLQFLHLLQETELEYKNNVVVQYLSPKIAKLEEAAGKETPSSSRGDKTPIATAVPLSDVFDRIDRYTAHNVEYEKLGFAIKILYTAYLKRFEKIEQSKGKDHLADNDSNITEAIKKLTKDDFYGKVSAQFLPRFKMVTGQFCSLAHIENINMKKVYEKQKWFESIQKFPSQLVSLCKKLYPNVGAVNSIETDFQNLTYSQNANYLKMKELYQFEEIIQLFLRRGTDGLYSFDILQVFVGCMSYKKLFEAYREETYYLIKEEYETKQKLPSDEILYKFLEDISIYAQMNEWFESYKNKGCVVASPFPVLDLDYTSEMLHMLRHRGSTLGAIQDKSDVVFALHEVFVAIRDFINKQHVSMFGGKDNPMEQIQATNYCRMYNDCPVSKKLHESLFLDYLAKRIYNPTEFSSFKSDEGFLPASNYNSATRKVDITFSSTMEKDMGELLESPPQIPEMELLQAKNEYYIERFDSLKEQIKDLSSSDQESFRIEHYNRVQSLLKEMNDFTFGGLALLTNTSQRTAIVRKWKLIPNYIYRLEEAIKSQDNKEISIEVETSRELLVELIKLFSVIELK